MTRRRWTARLSRRLLVALVSVALSPALHGCLTLRSAQPAASESEAPGSTSSEDAASPSAPPPLDLTTLPPATQRYAVLNRLLAQDLTRANRSCRAVARALTAWTDAHGVEFRALQREVDAWEARAGRYTVKRYYDTVFPDIDVRIEAATRCDGQRVTRRAFDHFFKVVGFTDE